MRDRQSFCKVAMMDGRDRPSLKTGTLMQVSIVKTNPEGTEAAAQSIGYVVLLATTAAISGFLFGFDTAVINGVLLFLRRQFTLSNLQTEVAASSLLLGCLLGAAGASIIESADQMLYRAKRGGRNRVRTQDGTTSDITTPDITTPDITTSGIIIPDVIIIPGTIAIIEPEPSPGAGTGDEMAPAIDAHTMNPDVVLATLARLGGAVGCISLFLLAHPVPASGVRDWGKAMKDPAEVLKLQVLLLPRRFRKPAAGAAQGPSVVASRLLFGN